MSAASDIVTALEALMKARAEGAADLSEFYDKRMGDLGITRSSSLRELREQHGYWTQQVALEEGGGYSEIVLI